MAKLVLLPLLLLAACVAAGLYGALHNQISYTISPDYFLAFKFHQFAIPESMQNRLGASVVGWYASWWMGLIIGVPVLLVGLIIMPDGKTYWTHGLIAFAVVAGTALLVGVGAVVYGYFTISEDTLQDFHYPPGVADRVAFARAGTMHNFSYVGGGLGIITGSAYLIIARWRMNKRST
jgi:hypothetical protein